MADSNWAGSYARPLLAVIFIVACLSSALIWIQEPILRRAMIVAGVCLTLWLTEVVPPYVPTFVLWALTPLLLFEFGEQFQLTRVLAWSANPVLALFLGGFALSVERGKSRNSIRSLGCVLFHIEGDRKAKLSTLKLAIRFTLAIILTKKRSECSLHSESAVLQFRNPDGISRLTLEGLAMSANLNVLAADNLFDTTGGGVVWHRLHSEREDICEALLKESPPSDETSGAARLSTEDALRAADWHRELLQARLQKVDDALDRLMSGSYGECRKCGKWIEDPKLDFDPAIAYCLDCWSRMQPIH